MKYRTIHRLAQLFLPGHVLVALHLDWGRSGLVPHYW